MSSIEIEWLPLGSVVKIKDVDTPVMICSRLQQDLETKKVWEYAACPYPQGSFDYGRSILFNGDTIEHVLFIGYRTFAELEFCKLLTDAVRKGEAASNMEDKSQDQEIHNA